MRHARDDDLDQLEPMLEALRQLPGLRENKRGHFYRGSRAFLHFHADPVGFFADVRLDEEFERFRVTTSAEQKRVLARVAEVVR